MQDLMRKLLRAMAAALVLFGCGGALAAPPPLSVYGNLPAVEFVALSPSGERVALAGLVEGQRRLVVLDRERKPLLAVPLGKEKLHGLTWAGEDRVLIDKSDTARLMGYTTDKTELHTIVVVPLDGTPMWAVFDHNEFITGGVQDFYGVRQRGDAIFGYFSAITYDHDLRGSHLNSYAPVLYEVDLRTGKAIDISPRFEPGFRDWAMGPDGKVAATLDFATKPGTWTLHNGAGVRIGGGTNPLGHVGLVALGATAGTVIYSEQTGDDEVRWFEQALAGGEPKEILADDSKSAAFVDRRTSQFVGFRHEQDVPAYTFFDPFRQKVANATLKAFPGLNVHLKSWNDRFDTLVVMTDGPGDAGTWWTVDIRTGKAAELGNAYLIDAADVGPMRMVTWKAADGMPIAGVLTLPPGREAKGLPVVVLPHGGPADRDYPVFDWWAQAFASRGYAVLQPNFRGSTGYGIAFRQAGQGQWGRAMQSDISAGLADLAAQGIVDPRRACIMGASYGGYAALAGVTLQQKLYRCAVAVAGVADVVRMVNTDMNQSGFDPFLKRALKEELGSFADLRAISPITFAAQADAPILLIHGKDDVVVPYTQSKAMAAALQAAGKPVEFVTLADEGHWLLHGETRLAMLEAAMRFVMQHNPPDPAR